MRSKVKVNIEAIQEVWDEAMDEVVVVVVVNPFAKTRHAAHSKMESWSVSRRIPLHCIGD